MPRISRSSSKRARTMALRAPFTIPSLDGSAVLDVVFIDKDAYDGDQPLLSVRRHDGDHLHHHVFFAVSLIIVPRETCVVIALPPKMQQVFQAATMGTSTTTTTTTRFAPGLLAHDDRLPEHGLHVRMDDENLYIINESTQMIAFGPQTDLGSVYSVTTAAASSSRAV